LAALEKAIVVNACARAGDVCSGPQERLRDSGSCGRRSSRRFTRWRSRVALVRGLL